MDIDELVRRSKLVPRTCDGEPMGVATVQQLTQLLLDSAAEVRVKTNNGQDATYPLFRALAISCEIAAALGIDELESALDRTLPAE